MLLQLIVWAFRPRQVTKLENLPDVTIPARSILVTLQIQSMSEIVIRSTRRARLQGMPFKASVIQVTIARMTQLAIWDGVYQLVHTE